MPSECGDVEMADIWAGVALERERAEDIEEAQRKAAG